MRFRQTEAGDVTPQPPADAGQKSGGKAEALAPQSRTYDSTIDRARTPAQNGMRRAEADLDKMQSAQCEAHCCSASRTQSQPVPQPTAEPSVAEFIDSRSIRRGPASQKAA